MTQDIMLGELRACLALLTPTGPWCDVELTHSKWCINHRPNYCDRGQYYWLCDSTDERKCTIDAADGFPRYFFQLDALMMEIAAWCDARQQQIVSFQLNTMDREGTVIPAGLRYPYSADVETEINDAYERLVAEHGLPSDLFQYAVGLKEPPLEFLQHIAVCPTCYKHYKRLQDSVATPTEATV